MNTQYCKGCDTVKPWSEFTIRQDTHKPCTLCKACRNKQKRKTPEHVDGVPSVPEHAVHVSEHHAEIMNELHALRQEVAELRTLVKALRKGVKTPNGTGEAPILDVPAEPAAHERVTAKLMGINFEQVFEDIGKKGGF